MLASCTKCYEVLREALVTMQRDLLILITKVMPRYKQKFNSQSHLIVYQHYGSWNREVGGLNTPWPRMKPRSNEDASWCKLMRVASLACVWPPTRINSHQLWTVSNFNASTCKSTRVFARLTGHESCCMRVVDKFWTASGFYFVATGSTKLLSVFLVNFRSTLIDSHATLVLVWPSNHASSCKSMQTVVCQLASTRTLVLPGLDWKSESEQ